MNAVVCILRSGYKQTTVSLHVLDFKRVLQETCKPIQTLTLRFLGHVNDSEVDVHASVDTASQVNYYVQVGIQERRHPGILLLVSSLIVQPITFTYRLITCFNIRCSFKRDWIINKLFDKLPYYINILL